MADGVRYAVGAPCCPECGAVEAYEEGDKTMAKISREAGPSDLSAAGEPEPVDTIHGDADGDDLETFAEQEAAGPELHGNATTNEVEAEQVVANGTVSDVLAWVGSDPDRALAALTAEQARPTPRTGVAGPLTTIVENATVADDGTGE